MPKRKRKDSNSNEPTKKKKEPENSKQTNDLFDALKIQNARMLAHGHKLQGKLRFLSPYVRTDNISVNNAEETKESKLHKTDEQENIVLSETEQNDNESWTGVTSSESDEVKNASFETCPFGVTIVDTSYSEHLDLLMQFEELDVSCFVPHQAFLPSEIDFRKDLKKHLTQTSHNILYDFIPIIHKHVPSLVEAIEFLWDFTIFRDKREQYLNHASTDTVLKDMISCMFQTKGTNINCLIIPLRIHHVGERLTPLKQFRMGTSLQKSNAQIALLIEANSSNSQEISFCLDMMGNGNAYKKFMDDGISLLHTFCVIFRKELKSLFEEDVKIEKKINFIAIDKRLLKFEQEAFPVANIEEHSNLESPPGRLSCSSDSGLIASESDTSKNNSSVESKESDY